MYIEAKGGDGLVGPARIGRVTFSKSGQSVHYNGRTFQTLGGRGFKANYFDVETNEEYWISGCKKDGRREYWSEIRNRPDLAATTSFRATGKHRT